MCASTLQINMYFKAFLVSFNCLFSEHNRESICSVGRERGEEEIVMLEREAAHLWIMCSRERCFDKRDFGLIPEAVRQRAASLWASDNGFHFRARNNVNTIICSRICVCCFDLCLDEDLRFVFRVVLLLIWLYSAEEPSHNMYTSDSHWWRLWEVVEHCLESLSWVYFLEQCTVRADRGARQPFLRVIVSTHIVFCIVLHVMCMRYLSILHPDVHTSYCLFTKCVADWSNPRSLLKIMQGCFYLLHHSTQMDIF